MPNKAIDPCAWSLPKTVEGARQETDVVWALGVDEACRLLAVDAFVKVVVEECIGDIELISRPIAGRHKQEYGGDGRRLDHRRESFTKVAMPGH